MTRVKETHLLLGLALAAGCVDAQSFLGLGRVFTANMTGNSVLLGIAVATGSSADALRSVAALGGFVLGGAVGILLISGRRGAWRRATAPVFGLETVSLLALLVIWQAVGVSPVRYLLIVLSGVAMGAQSAATRASSVPGVNTTYMTSTLLNAVARIVLRDRRARARAEDSHVPGLAWTIYFLGALAGAAAINAWHAAASAIPLAIVAVVSVLVIFGRSSESAAAPPKSG
jgi:uncharacterized membrane protein YoaK (UPF0700 family)